MKAIIVNKIRSILKNGIKKAIVLIYEGDEQEQPFFTIPNIESLPIDSEKCLLLSTNKNGKSVLFGVPLKTDIEEGEIKIKGLSSNGAVQGQIYINNEGEVEIGLRNLKPLVTDTIVDILNAMVLPVNLTALTAGPLAVPIQKSLVTTSKTKAQ